MASPDLTMITSDPAVNEQMYAFAGELFPICRSLTGEGVRATLRLIADRLPGMQMHSVPSGTRCSDWTVPDEWNIRDACVIGPRGDKIIDFQRSNLHVVGYSEPIDAIMPLEELQKHLHSLPEQPDAIPYVTSYYSRRWGFCLAHREREQLQPGEYHVVIDSTLAPGSLNYGELVIPGETDREVLLSTYVCHPSLANNEISGPVVTTALGAWLQSLSTRRYTYRLLFIPETIGSIAYLSLHLPRMKSHIAAGFVVTCVGDDRAYSFMPSRKGNTLADRVARHVLHHHAPDYQAYGFAWRGSDERQYCSAGVDLPVVSVMRSKYATYPEYHTSLDDLQLISPAGLGGAYDALRKCIGALELNRTYRTTCVGEPQLGRRGLYAPAPAHERRLPSIVNVACYSDGETDLLSIADEVDSFVLDLAAGAKKLLEAGLIEDTEVNR